MAHQLGHGALRGNVHRHRLAEAQSHDGDCGSSAADVRRRHRPSRRRQRLRHRYRIVLSQTPGNLPRLQFGYVIYDTMAG